MKITNFEGEIEQKIIDRGFDYYESDYILEFEKISNDMFKGLVRGTYLYNIVIKIDENLEIINASCDCPYDYEIYCKHQVALMYMINDLEAYQLDYKISGNIEVVEKEIGKMKKGELVELIKKMCISDRNSLNKVLTFLNIDDDIYEESIRYYE